MKLPALLIFLFLLIIGSSLFSQDTLTPIKTLQNLKRGIYFTYKEFTENIPSYTDSFIIVKDYSVSLREDSTIDSTFNGYTFKLVDSTKKIRKVFGFFDSKNFFIDAQRGLDFRAKKYFTPVDYIGKYPFLEFYSKKPITIMNIGAGAFIEDALSKKKKVLLYINKDGDIVQATAPSIWFFLKKDKEFLKEYDAEKNTNMQVYKKYLLKMNEKYSFFN